MEKRLMVKNLSAMQETRVWFLGQEDPPEKEMATHSSILIWKIPWTEEPGRLQTIRSRVGHDLVIKPPPQQKLTQLCKATLAQLKKKKASLPNNIISWSYKKKSVSFVQERNLSLFLRSWDFKSFFFLFFKLHHWKLIDCILE